MENERWLVTHFPRSFAASVDQWNEIQRLLRERFSCHATTSFIMENNLLLPEVRSEDDFSASDLREANQLVREFFFS